MKKKEQMLEFLKLVRDVFEEKAHHFDANSEECKACKSFAWALSIAIRLASRSISNTLERISRTSSKTGLLFA